jgi:hypothetical protein
MQPEKRMTPDSTQRLSAKSYLKQILLPKGRAARVIRGGLLAGLCVEMDFAHRTQLWLGLQERELEAWFRRFSAGISTAIDVGANEGLYTLYFLAKTPAQKVFAFEPEIENLSHLERNLALNQLASDPRLELVRKFVGATVGREFTSLDAFSAAITPPCLVKVDIDGGEVDLLRGAPILLRAPSVRWIIEVHSIELEMECLEILRAADYRTVVVPNAWWRVFLPELRPIAHNRWLVASREEL